ncbi:hypothetical protein K439DRAFT_1374786, partial [Ramaria rubella]
LQSSDIRGLTIPLIHAAYLSQYRNALIGKHFKTLMQVMPFHVHGLVTNEQFILIKVVGRLSAVVWYHEIANMPEYLADLKVLIGNVLDAFDLVDPMCIIDKAKLHVLVHLQEDIEQFGLAIRFTTEVFECFNHIFQMCSILSNHQAPGRDIAIKCASMERIKHIMCRDYWKNSSGDWVQASPRVQNILNLHPIIQRHLGWVPREDSVLGAPSAS